MSKKRRGGRTLVGGEARGRGGLILPGQARRGAATLYVPSGYEDGREPPVLVGTCATCDRVFHRGEEEEWQRHVGWCYRQHEAEVRGAREEQKKRLWVFQEEAWDTELAAHFEKVGKQMLREGRLTMRPNERADG